MHIAPVQNGEHRALRFHEQNGVLVKSRFTLECTCFTQQTHAINPALYKNLPFDPIKDFMPISLIGSVPVVLMANLSFPAKTANEFVAYAKAHPGKVNYGPPGKTLNTPEVQQRLTEMGLEVTPSTSEQLGAFVRAEVAKWGKVVRDAGVTAD